MERLRYDKAIQRWYGTQHDGTPIEIDAYCFEQAVQQRVREGLERSLAEARTADPDSWSEEMEGWISLDHLLHAM